MRWKTLIQLLCISETLSVYRCYGETMTGRNKELMCYTVYQVKCSRSANNRRMWYSVKHIICPPRGIAVTVKSALCEFKPCWDPWLNWSLKIVVLNQMTWFVLHFLPFCHHCETQIFKRSDWDPCQWFELVPETQIKLKHLTSFSVKMSNSLSAILVF